MAICGISAHSSPFRVKTMEIQINKMKDKGTEDKFGFINLTLEVSLSTNLNTWSFLLVTDALFPAMQTSMQAFWFLRQWIKDPFERFDLFYDF